MFHKSINKVYKTIFAVTTIYTAIPFFFLVFWFFFHIRSQFTFGKCCGICFPWSSLFQSICLQIESILLQIVEFYSFHNWLIFCCTYVSSFLYPFIWLKTPLFNQILAIVNNTAVNMVVRASFQAILFHSFEQIPNSSIAGAHDKSISIFRNL